MKQLTVDYEIYEEELEEAYRRGYKCGEELMLFHLQDYLLGVPKEEIWDEEALKSELLNNTLGDIDNHNK